VALERIGLIDVDGVTHLTLRLARGSEPAEERPHAPD
jgi:hypothetical protein